MASEADGDDDAILLLVHELPLDMDGDHGRHLAHILPPQHTGGGPPPSHPFRPPPSLQAATSAEPRLSFRGWLGAPRHWDLWVAKLRPIHAHLWRRLGIHDSVLASTFRFRRDATALLHLASFWCPRTNTFAFPWGEATITLQDIALLAGFPAHGAPVPAPLAPEWRPDEAALNGVRLGFNRGACKKAHHSAWIKHFLAHDHAASPEHEHAAFLALWLTRFVLPGHPESTMRQSLFPIAVRLARGERLALGPAVLASLYRDLRDIKAFLVVAAATGNTDMLSSLSLYAPLYILQLWMWERFPALRPGRENSLIDGDPMAARWHDLSRKINPTLIHEALSSADTFLWQPYPPCSMHTTGCWVHRSDLAGNDDLRTLAHCLRPCELVGMDCIEQYLPHRVARQFGLDQDVPGGVPRANQNWAVAWQTYDLEGKNVAFFIPHAEQSRVTTRYTHWWKQLLPHSDIDDAAAPSAPVEWKTSKRKVKKTLAAMEAEEEKHRLKKARASPVTTSDKKRKLEELYDSKLSNWLTAARNEIGDAACGSYQRGSFLPRYDTASDEALLPNVGTTNDDVVLLVPRKQTTSPAAVLPTNDSCISPRIGDRGTFIADIPNETAQVTTTMLQEEKVMIPAYMSPPDVTGSPEEGTTVVMELEKEASAASSNPVEITASVTEENKEKFATEGTSCAAGMMNPPVKGIAVAMEADEHNAVSEEVGKAADEAIEVATQSQQGVDAGAMNYSHIAVTLPEEAHPIHHRNNGGGCSKVSCTMEDYNVAGALSTDAGVTACHDSVIEEQRKVPSIEVTGVGGDHQVVEKDNEKKPQEAPQIERVESAQDTALTGSSNEGENKTDHPTVAEVATSDSMVAALLGVLEAENAEVMKDLNPAKKCTEDMPMEVAGGEAGLEQVSTSTKGTTEEEHKKFYEVDSHTDTEKPGQAAEVVCPEIDGAMGAENAEVKRDISLGKNDTEDMSIEVAGGEEAVTASSKGGANMEHKELSEVDHTDIVEPKMHSHTHIEKPDEADAVECAEIDGTMRLNGRDTVGEKLGVVPEIGKDEIQKHWGLIVGIKDEMLAKVSEVEHAKVEVVKSMMEDDTDNKYEDVRALENSGSGNTYGTVEEDDGRLNEVHNVSAEVEGSDGHEMDIDGRGCVMQEDLQMRYDTSGEVHIKEKFLADGNLTDKPLSEQETKEEPLLDGEGLPDKDVGVSKEAYKVKQAEGKGCKVEMEEEEESINDVLRVEKIAEQGKELTVKDIHDHVEEITQAVQVDGQNKSLTTVGTDELPEQTSQAQEKEFDKDSMDDSKNSGNGGIPCRSATVQLKPDQMEVSHEDMMQEEHIQNVEPNDQMEPSSDAAAMLVEGVFEHKTLDTHEEATLKLEQDHKIICDYREKTIFEGSHVMDTGVKPASATLDIDEAQAALVIQSQKKIDMDKQLAMEERQDQHIILETNKMDMSKGADIMVCDEHQSNQTSIEINEVKSPKGMLNQEPFNNEEQLAIEERQDLETTAENNKIYMSEDADILSCSEYQINPSGMVIDEDGSTQRIQRQELLDNEVVIEERIEFTADRSGIPLEEAYNAAGDGVTTFTVAVDNSDSTQNKEASNMKLLLTADKQHHGVEILNEKRISEDTSMPGSGELNSDATVLEVMAGSREGTPNQRALGAEMAAAGPEKKDQGTADENTKRNLADIDPHECGVKPDEAGNTFHGTLLTAQASNIPGFEIASENKQKETSFGNQNITEVEGPESNQTVMKDPEEALSPEPENPVEVKKENLENETEMSVCRDNDEESEKDHISAEVTITPDLEEQSDNGTRLAKESTKSCENLAPNPKNTGCVLKLGKSSIEDVKRTYNTRSMYLKDIKESLGRIRAEPLNRVQTTSTGNYSRHAVQEPISVCKEIKVPLRDSARDFGRERAAELALTSPAEETSRWRQEQYALQILEDVQNSRMAEKTRMEMEIRVLKAQIASMERQVMNLDHFAEVKSRLKRH